MPKTITLKDHYREARIFKVRSVVALAGVSALACLLIGRMYFLQISEYEIHTTKSDRNRINVQPIPPTRGLILDRSNILLAENRAGYAVTITKETATELEQSLDILKQLLDLKDSELERFQKRIVQRRRPYEPVPLKFNLNEEEIARVAVNQHRLPGINISADLVRNYPHGKSTAHVVGYVGRINSKEEKVIDRSNYSGTHHIGKIGLEQFYEKDLHGQVGLQRVETNVRGRILRTIDQTSPLPGKNLKLFLDLPTQKAALEALDGRRGAVVAIDPNTGGILAFVSAPSFNPNLFVTGISYENYNGLNTSLDRPLFNRALKGQYPPGSTIKQFVGLAGLENNAVKWNHTITDPGFYKLENDDHLYRDWQRRGHGRVDLHKAIVESCDTYFYILAKDLNIERIHDFMTQFNFGRATNIDLFGERIGILPSAAWKRRRHNLPWFPGETLIAGIGQGFMLATPLQLAVSTAILANRGKVISPRLVDHRVETSPVDEADLVIETEQEGPTQGRLIQLSNTNNWASMITAMEDVVHSNKGTARSIAEDLNFKIAGKTGSAQVIAIAQDSEYDEEKIAERFRDHALFVGFAPIDDPKIALAVVVENGGSGGSNAAPVGREVFEAYFASLAGSPNTTPSSDDTQPAKLLSRAPADGGMPEQRF